MKTPPVTRRLRIIDRWLRLGARDEQFGRFNRRPLLAGLDDRRKHATLSVTSTDL